MDVELVTEGTSDDEGYRIDENNEVYMNFDGERCGICMDIVIDRGVLDCCQHWFCFTCIDNWATITNLCPLCQNEFQLITCVPVYDTIGSNKTDEDSYSRDDDWCIEGKNNTLSFPSYYIDENAVVCLDGDGCKIRSRSAAMEADSNLDTSIACDSCDIWYHAFCVGFDPEGACENSWLCPRCLVDQLPKKLDGVLVPRLGNQHEPENARSGGSGEAAFSGKVSVSVADAGETAVVVSVVEGSRRAEEPGGEHSTLDFTTDTKADASLSSNVAFAPQCGDLSSERLGFVPKSESEELKLSLSGDICFSSQFPSIDLTVKADKEETGEQKLVNKLGMSSTKCSSILLEDKMAKSGLDLHLGLSVNSSSTVDMINNTSMDDHELGLVYQKSSSGHLLSADGMVPHEEVILTVGRMMPDKNDDTTLVSGEKRKHKDTGSLDDGECKAEIDANAPLKKVKVEAIEGTKLTPLKDPVPYDSRQFSSTTNIENSEPTCASEKKNVSDVIMDIVQETGRRRPKPLAHANSSNISSRKREKSENAAGLRVKKIMRRTDEDADSSVLVQKLRKEIREAVRNKSSKEIGESLFDPKLLAAFRAAVSGSVAETKKPPLDLKAKKALLQKGKVRENLTKKIYGMGGRRRRAWTRDCEVEFWKHRCSNISRPEKIQTLKSVLDVLRNDTVNKEIKHHKEGEASSILSRLYLADTSIFPRKHNIRPVSASKGDAVEKNQEQNTPEKLEVNPMKHEVSKKPVVSVISDSNGTKKGASGVKAEAASTKSCPNNRTERPSTSKLGGSKVASEQEITSATGSMKTDKRKWALEVLARKTAVTPTTGVQEKEEDSVMLKGNFPLLAQLPKDMRPSLAPIRHNKIPIAVRQAQLYRLLEHFLRKANLSIIRRTAETELAVADAINIEKEVADKSNSKLVYVNLCSQELSRRSDNMNLSRDAETSPPTSGVSSDGEKVTNDSNLEVNEALKTAGLLSDTPPNSPSKPVEEIKEDAGFLNKSESDGPDNVFEMDSQPELDIYGDFDYDLEDDYFVGASALKISKLQQEVSKMKVLFSTLNPDASNGSQDICDHEGSAGVGPTMASSGHEFLTDAGNSTVDGRANDNQPQNTRVDEVYGELSLAECEELYGPDKEPLIEKYPETALVKPCELVAGKEIVMENGCHGSSEMAKTSESKSGNLAVSEAHQGSVGSVNSPSHSQNTEKVQRKEKMSTVDSNKLSDSRNFVSKKVEAYIKEHIRPLCKSGVITVEQYRWAVGKTTEKVMKYHSKEQNANFLIKEGEKVKKLAEQYVEAAQQTAKAQ
ncbi:uncharacterized protein At4g10930 isoform X1 [Coffea arabica]|uniref:Uncharacterized protein At4g10930-like isoform X1 n=2 Tax=Coffea arabica TaxID=13443 RepID=A0A6P6TX12_COFAR|nr:uncharacterized protein At4g10930-like isoform X1 [Coffea arabica]XP_027082884.1 uncharacterized protein At4g10930-like isoform X1 [Coffea arabica]